MNQPTSFYVYLLTNSRNTVIYVGVTNNLIRRVKEHKKHLIKGFTSKYNVEKLVHFEVFTDKASAVAREKQIKAGSRRKKIVLIIKTNPDWQDLYDNISIKI